MTPKISNSGILMKELPLVKSTTSARLEIYRGVRRSCSYVIFHSQTLPDFGASFTPTLPGTELVYFNTVRSALVLAKDTFGIEIDWDLLKKSITGYSHEHVWADVEHINVWLYG